MEDELSKFKFTPSWPIRAPPSKLQLAVNRDIKARLAQPGIVDWEAICKGEVTKLKAKLI